MITNFKIFENKEEYKQYDYVYVNIDEETVDNKPVYHPFCQILIINNNAYKFWDYFVESCKSEKKLKTLFIIETQIERKLTEEEIEYYKTKKAMDDFNL